MSAVGRRKIFAWTSACVAMALFANGASAEPQKFGPVPVAITVNKVPLALAANGIVDMNTARGNVNARGDLVASMPAAALTTAAVEVLKTLLPQDIPTEACTVRVHKVTDLHISSQSNELRVRGKVEASLFDCRWYVSVTNYYKKNRTVGFELALQPLPSPKKLSFKVMRTPTIDLPDYWITIGWGNVPKKIEEALTTYAEASPLWTVPAPYGARMAIQGASVSGDTETVSLLLRGDAHIDERGLTSVLMDGVDELKRTQKLNFTIALAAPATN